MNSFSWLSCPLRVGPSHLYLAGWGREDFYSCSGNLADLQNTPPAGSFCFVSYISCGVWTNILSLIALKQEPSWRETTCCWLSGLGQEGNSDTLSGAVPSGDQTMQRAKGNAAAGTKGLCQPSRGPGCKGGVFPRRGDTMQIEAPFLCFSVQDVWAPIEENTSGGCNFCSVDGETAGDHA